jgi:hypothetical protein
MTYMHAAEIYWGAVPIMSVAGYDREKFEQSLMDFRAAVAEVIAAVREELRILERGGTV